MLDKTNIEIISNGRIRVSINFYWGRRRIKANTGGKKMLFRRVDLWAQPWPKFSGPTLDCRESFFRNIGLRLLDFCFSLRL